ncbi:hypothetical protein L3X38_041427 [Prunus dulcis]|uniref:Uncharacterized protein n=1 Tax=Prunus dulcis TaxID=3755 RepID=A0AAD4UT17_PRUDU|nr:hypothetical protein L3X38_041427 [Prunus dulcis]
MSLPHRLDQAKVKDVNRRHELAINLAFLGAKKNTPRADERNFRNEERSSSGSKNSRERSLSPVSNANLSTCSYHGSPSDDQQKKIAMKPSASICESYSMAMQDKELGQDVHKKGPHHEAESGEKGLGHETELGEKLHRKGDIVSVGSLLVQQLQDMIMNTIRAQYGGPYQDTFIYSKPYTKRLDNLRMPMGYQPPKFMQFDGKGNPKQHVAYFIEMCNNAGTNDDYS